MRILITGSTGYIGSHTVVELLNNKYDVIGVDDFSNSSPEVLDRIKKITGKTMTFYEGDICNKTFIEHVFKCEKIDAVIHFAGYKAVSESIEHPLRYYKNNVLGSLVLFEIMKKYNVKTLVFSSSATVYGNNNKVPLTEEMPLAAINPYGESKVIVERILEDLYASDCRWHIATLRYFNPVGAHESGLIGENPKGIPNNLMPYVTQVAVGKRDYLSVFGNQYNTSDGTGVRDYIHVVDLARGHMCALNYLSTHSGLEVFNLGSGKGISVLEVINQFEASTGVHIPYKLIDPRSGDVACNYADCSKANKVLHWKAKKSFVDICQDAWRWQQNNPNGYTK